jgi:hypothetical protein
VMGNGRQRPRRRFTREHVIAFLRGASPGAAKGRHATELARVREAVRRQAAKVRS